MAIYYQNFETFAVGAIPPYGSLTGNANNATIVADNYLETGSRAAQTANNFSSLTYSDGSLYTSATLYVAWKHSEANNQTFLQYENGTAGSGFPNILTIVQEPDNSISVKVDNNGTFAGNSGDHITNLNIWHWLQVNTTFSAIPIVSGTTTTTKLGVAVEIGLDGTSILNTGTTTTNRNVSSMNSGTAQFDRIVLLNNSIWDEFSFDVLQTMNTYPNPGVPAMRATTALIEPLELVDSAAIRASTGLIELLISNKNKRVYEM